jgi:uncharacterized membrane protein
MSHRNDAQGHSRPIFSAVLTPHRSLTPRGLLAVMALFGAASLIVGTVFFLAGAWPIAGFLGFDVALVYLAFRLSNRQACAFETVEVTREALTVRKVDARGRSQSFGLDPYWTRIEVARREWGITGLWLANRGERLAIGRFLNPAERESLAKALSAALAEARDVPAATA